MIRELKESDINGLNNLPPVVWKFDYETFLRDFIIEEYFFVFVLIQDERIVGTGNVFLKGKIGWLANIMVNPNNRGKGLGYEITKFLINFLKEKKCETQLLIATELGEVVYQKIGLKKITEYLCFDSDTDNNYELTDSIRELKKTDLENVCELDKAANGENRSHLISKYYVNGLVIFIITIYY